MPEESSKVVVDLEKIKQVLATGASPVQVYDAYDKLAKENGLVEQARFELRQNVKAAIALAWPTVRSLSISNGQRKPQKGGPYGA